MLKGDAAELKRDHKKHDGDISDLKADNRLIKWMVTFNLAGTMGVLWLILRTMLR